MSDVSTMQQIVDFILELDRLKGVTRKNRPLGLERYENSAEHSWQIALLALSLAPYAGASIDINRVVGMLLVHDIGEIDTGDTMVYVVGGWEERKAAELVAVTRIFGLLAEPQRSELRDLWLEFEQAETEEALFANAADRAIPVLLNLARDGQSWRENEISFEQVVNRVGPPIKAGCPSLWDYLLPRLEAERQKGWYGVGQTKQGQVG
jgi:putative hydrolases of HD superfamily